jgi:hypothetical protein
MYHASLGEEKSLGEAAGRMRGCPAESAQAADGEMEELEIM